MHVAYGGRDEFNMDAQIESFLYVARERGLTVSVGYLPHGHHGRLRHTGFIPASEIFSPASWGRMHRDLSNLVYRPFAVFW